MKYEFLALPSEKMDILLEYQFLNRTDISFLNLNSSV